VIGRRGIEIGPGRPAPLGQPGGRVEVEGRRTDRHGDDPLTGRPPGGLAADEGLDVGDGAAAGQRRTDELQPFPIEVSVGIHQAGNHRGAPEIEDTRAAPTPAADVDGRAGSGDPIALDGQRGDHRPARVQREDAAVRQDPVGGRYFIHPFSR
jgi:hypothetical protein